MLKDWTASDKIDKLSPQAEVFFTRLIMKADDYGVFPVNIRLVRSALFPLKDYAYHDVSKWLIECEQCGLIGRFTDGETYLYIKNFDQTLRRPKHTYPPPPDGQARTSDGQVTDKRGEKLPELEVEEEEEGEEEENKKAFSAFENSTFENGSIDARLDAALVDTYTEPLLMNGKHLYPGVDINLELARFRQKVKGSPRVYAEHDTGGLRLAFEHQLRSAKPTIPNGKPQRVKSFNLDDV